MDRTYKYTVCTRCFTYNHAPYIWDALDGFVAQQTDFPVVYTIVDDASTDGEPQLLRNYFNENFEADDSKIAYKEEMDYGSVLFGQHRVNRNCFFALILLRDNHYSKKRSKLPYISRWQDNAKYIALCEGDDYWVDSFKLKKQADYMNEHPECSMCAHAAFWKTGNDIRKRGCAHGVECDLTTDEVIRHGGYYLATASLFFKSDLVHLRPEWRIKANVGDFPLQILGSLNGTLHFFPEAMCVYRYMVEGSFSIRNKVFSSAYLAKKIEWMRLLNEDTRSTYSKAIYFNLYNTCYRQLYRDHHVSFFTLLSVYLKSDRKVYNLKSLVDAVRAARLISRNKDSN